MAQSDVAQVANQIKTFWSDLFMDELREAHMLAALVNKEYEGQIQREGDTVRVSQINAPEGQTRTVGTDADSFTSALLTTTSVDVKADKRFVASFKLVDLVDIQSQLGSPEGKSKIREALVFAMTQQINDYLYGIVAPSTSAPDHVRSGIATFDAAELLNNRLLAAQAKWGPDWWLLLDPQYYNHLLNAQTMTSSDYIGADQPVIGGKIVNKRFGFNILEDNSRGILKLSPAAAGASCGLAFHPDFCLFVSQTEPSFQLSSLHSQEKFGYVLSVDLIGGAKIGINGNVKHIQIYNT